MKETPLTFDQMNFWGGISKGIPSAKVGSKVPAITQDNDLMKNLFSVFAFGNDTTLTKLGSMRNQPTCRSNPDRLECNTVVPNRSWVFPPQQLHSQRVGAPDGPTCSSPIAGTTKRQADPIYGEDVPRVYVTDGCKPITPEVGPTEPTRDTTYGKMLWMNPVFTFPDAPDRNAVATGIIWDSQRKASDNFDEWHYETFTKNSPDYVQYTNY